jgi:glycosyltransferase involved in cell wall biosynthesis
LSGGLVQRGHEVTVYNSHNHPYRQASWKGVRRVRCYDPEYLMGTAGQFVYDLNCILHARRQHYNVILFMGYTSSSIWAPLFPRDAVILSNMDGMEWQRAKYACPVQRFLRYAERLAVRHSDFHIADSEVVQDYLQGKYAIQSQYIPYGACCPQETDNVVLAEMGLTKGGYYMLMARVEPENNIELILEGYRLARSSRKFVVVGSTQNKYGRYLLRRFSANSNIVFTQGIYDPIKVHTLRAFSRLYFHGHSVGGTNPSLLEAMASGALIAAHDNPFNKAILGGDAYYFSSAEEIAQLVSTVSRGGRQEQMQRNNFKKIETLYSWEQIIDQYEAYICSCYNAKNNEQPIYSPGYAGQ